MQKIMFNDKYGLTQAVLDCRKTMTRRVMVKQPSWVSGDGHVVQDCLPPKFRRGDIVAVAQNLRDMGYDPRDTKHKPGEIWGLDHSPAWTNKMFVSASECIHRIRIIDVRAERLQDISDDDCLREGIYKQGARPGVPDLYAFDTCLDQYGDVLAKQWYKTPRKAFSALIDKVSGKGTWERNPWVFVYEFELFR